MIVSRCPLRVSLVGGSTDLIDFVEHNGVGSVISFPIDIYTYIFLSYNTDKNYRINYSNPETTTRIDDIKNDVAREVCKYFNLPPVTIVFNSDITSSGSGLASSSSYTIALVSAVNVLLDLNLSQFEICKISLDIEHKFNPLTGYQDSYGCGLGSLKRLNFYSGGKVTLSLLKSSLFSNINMYLVNTNTIRESNTILKSINFEKVKNLLKYVDDLENNLSDKKEIYKILNDAWEAKKQTSSMIANSNIEALGDKLINDNKIKAIKLCGAGGGGYFLIISEKKIKNKNYIKVQVDNIGVKSERF